MGPQSRIFLIIFLLCVSVQARGPAEVGIDIDNWLKQADGFFPKSPPYVATSRTIESAKKQIKSADLESPWAFTTTLQDTMTEKDPTDPLTSLHIIDSATGLLGLDYNLRSSFQVSLDVQYEINKYQDPIPAVYKNPDSPYNARLRFSYDILKGGSESAANASAKVTAIQAKRTVANTLNEQLQARIQLINLFVDLYVTECKIRELKRAQEFVGEAVKTGQFQLKSKTLSYKDYLTFVDLGNNFSRRQGTLEGAQIANINRAISWGNDAYRVATVLSTENISCTPKVKSSFSVPRDSIDLSKKLPAALAAELQVQAAQWTKKGVDQADDVSLRPFLEAAHSKDAQAERGFTGGTVGVTLQWNIGGEKTSISEQTAALDIQAAQDAYDRTLFQLQSTISTLQAQLTSQLGLIPVLDRSLKSSELLLKTLQAQKRIGTTDALGFANAYINMIDTIHSRLDNWGAIRKAYQELTYYVKFNEKLE